MKPRLSTKRNAAMTLFEVGIVVAVVIILAAVVVPGGIRLTSAHSRARTINCVNNLKQVGLAYRIWEGDNGDVLPMGIPVTNGGSMELVQKGDVVQSFLVMSNELSTPRVLFCPSEPTSGNRANDFAGLAGTNISYFVGVDTTNSMNPQMILSGDSSFGISGVSSKSGLVAYGSGDLVAWTPTTRHRSYGNIGFADGSVQSRASSGLRNDLHLTGLTTNRFAIP
jgi:prepilin-type processing-associated H-X9-DG protein